MKAHRSGRFFAFLALAALFLAACQPAALETSDPAVDPAAQPLEAGTQEPARIPTESVAVTQTPAPVEPGAAPSGEGAGLAQAGGQVPQGWREISLSQGYSLAYPPEWAECQVTRYSLTFCQVQEDPAWNGPALRLYVSVFPRDHTNADFEVYNFITPESIQDFMALAVGESRLREPNAMAPDYFTYTRLPDRMVAGLSAAVIENSRVWEAPPGTKDRVAFIVTEDTTYMLGLYYETPEQLAMFEQVLDSFRITP
jgi:hypothetical protein